ncbi:MULTISPECIES: hypothetical protein [unclassified Micromonospora]|uniref:hypothetical protein n=1 Tax=unclassified Micromonospora TaxID=2617518 RepID=UPI002FF13B17
MEEYLPGIPPARVEVSRARTVSGPIQSHDVEELAPSGNHDSMEALAGLFGAVVGGFLVLVGDVVRRRVEERRQGVRDLADAAIGLAVQYGRHVGQLKDGQRGLLTASDPLSADRYEASTRFFMTPGCEELREQALGLIREYQRLSARAAELLTYDDFGQYLGKERAFEAAVQVVVRRGRIKPSGDTRRRVRVFRRVVAALALGAPTGGSLPPMSGGGMNKQPTEQPRR